MEDENLEKWKRFLTPSILRTNLLCASIYISAFEILKSSIIDRIRDFYWSGYDGKNDILQPDYEIKVLSKAKSVTYASLLWLKEMDVITEKEIETFDKIRDYRNRLIENCNGRLT